MPPDTDEHGMILVDGTETERILNSLHEQIVRASSNTTVNDGDDNSLCLARSGSLQGATCGSSTLGIIKSRLPRSVHEISKLWDQENNEFTYCPQRIANLIAADAVNRQGLPRGNRSR